MSNGIGHVWAVNAEGGDEGRPNGVGPVWIENADQLGSKLPEPEAGDTGKVLGVLNADGDIGWVPDQEGMAQVQADWDQTDSSQVSYIANKPSLATVATTGAYSDLSGTPTIPTVDQTYDASSANAQSGVAVASALSGKQDTISDLNTIRSGAAAGATAVQPGSLATVATTGSYSDLSNKPTIPSVDQTYNAASTNAQSGVAVAQAIASIPSTSYTAGDGISIENDEISAKLGDGLEIGTSLSPVTVAASAVGCSNPDTGVTVMQPLSAELVSAIETAGLTYTVQNLTDNNNVSQPWVYGGVTSLKLYPAIFAMASYGTGPVTDTSMRLVLSTTGIDVASSSGTIPAGTQFTYNLDDVNTSLSTITWETISDQPEHYSLGVTWQASWGGWSCLVADGSYTKNALYESGTLSYQTATPGAITVSNPLPASTSSDSGKVLKIDANGNPEWGVGGAQADWTETDNTDPSYVQNKPEVLGFVAGSGISITESASTITIVADAQIPSYNTTTDVGKVLQVTANGLAWVSLS